MRLRFGDPESIKLVDAAPVLVSEYSSLARCVRRTRLRIWWQGSAKCEACRQALQRDELLVDVGRRVFHDACLVGRLVELRRKLKALGYRIDAGGLLS